jgi:hypothetical protein
MAWRIGSRRRFRSLPGRRFDGRRPLQALIPDHFGMLILRLLAILAVIAIGGGFVAFVLTGERRYLSFSWTVLRYSLIVGLILFALMAMERLIVLPF